MDYNMMDEYLSRGYDPQEDYTPHPMSIERYHAWCAENGITPNPQYGIFDTDPPF